MIFGFGWVIAGRVTPQATHTKLHLADRTRHIVTPFAAPRAGGAVVGISAGF
jgi:hypothetical protein